MKWLFLMMIISINSYPQKIFKKNYDKGKIKLKFIRAYPGDVSDEHFNLVLPSSREVEIVCETNYQRIDHEENKSWVAYYNFYNYYQIRYSIDTKKCQSFVHYLLKVFQAVDEKNPIYLTFNLETKKVSEIYYPDINPYTLTGEYEDLFPKPPVRFKIPKKNKKEKLPKEEDYLQIPLFH